ncbi:MAG: protein kinase [Rhodopirellula sp.]|nr:protein kinase [Rhodopirellula sp.]
MAANGDNPMPSSSRAAIADRIDCICDEFEAEILAGREPRIESFLDPQPEEIRPRLFKELLLLELDYRQRRGESPRLEEYASRFMVYRSILVGAGLVSKASTDAEADPAAKTTTWQPSPGRSSRFQFLRNLGSGAFGTVWLARDQQLDRVVAVKVPLKGTLTAKEEELFLREAKSAAQLHHPHIVRVYEAGRDGEQVFIVSEFIEGTTLKSHRETREYTPAESAELCARVAEALEHAHQRGVIHRDLKPGNILIDETGEPHIADFGLAKRETTDATWTRAGEVFGTPAYMSPEQARGDSARVDRRSDVYSLGVILYELLVGERPFTGDVASVLSKTLYLDPVPPRKHNSRIPLDLETICLKAMAKRPQDRYATAAEMAADLRRFLGGECVLARRIGPFGRAWRWARRRPKDVASAVLGLMALGAIAVLLNKPAKELPDNPAASSLRLVSLETKPPGAEVAFFPRDAWTGEPLPRKRILAAGRSPVRVELPPGEYLVVAKLDEGRFHEVFRHVPSEQEGLPGVYPHLRWAVSDEGTVRIPEIEIPSASVTDGMAVIEGSDRFAMGLADSTETPLHHRRIPSFLIDPREFSVADYRVVAGSGPPDLKWQEVPDDHAVSSSYNDVQRCAERAGKRLPTEAEYEYAATGGGRLRYPWGGEVPPEGAYEKIGPVGTPAWDRLDLTPPVFGLVSNVAEWTSTWFTLYPQYRAAGVREARSPCDYRVARGGNGAVIAGDGAVTIQQRDPRSRERVATYTIKPGLGFRCVRSVKARWEPEDFEAVLPSPPH